MTKITVNGSPKEVGAANVEDLVKELGVTLKIFVVERNRVVVPRDKLSQEPVREGDVIEIVRLMGGG